MTDFFNNQKPKVVSGLNLLSISDYKDIHLATLKVLEKTGVFVEDQQARELFGSCGARIDEKNSIVKLPSSMVEEAIQSAPAQVMLAGRTPERDVLLDNNRNAYLNFGGGINVVDPYTEVVRQSTKADLAASALKLTRKFCEAIMTASRAGFSAMIASMAMAGGTAPVNLAGVLVQTNAEILAGIVLTQLVRKGTPVIYSSFSTAMDLRLGTSPLGSPETALVAAPVAGLCRYYQLPCLVPGISSDSKQHGDQAAFEKTLTGVAAAMAGASLLVGIGGLETGLTFDFGQAVLDDEIVRISHNVSGNRVNKLTGKTFTIVDNVARFTPEAGNYASRRKCSCCDHQSG